MKGRCNELNVYFPKGPNVNILIDEIFVLEDFFSSTKHEVQ